MTWSASIVSSLRKSTSRRCWRNWAGIYQRPMLSTISKRLLPRACKSIPSQFMDRGKGLFSILSENSKIHNILCFKEMRKTKHPQNQRTPSEFGGFLTGYFPPGVCCPPQNRRFFRGFGNLPSFKRKVFPQNSARVIASKFPPPGQRARGGSRIPCRMELMALSHC
jgi:hypothetical protein